MIDYGQALCLPAETRETNETKLAHHRRRKEVFVTLTQRLLFFFDKGGQ